jgi:hypothetical protein
MIGERMACGPLGDVETLLKELSIESTYLPSLSSNPSEVLGVCSSDEENDIET